MDWSVIVSGTTYAVTAIQHANKTWMVVGKFNGRKIIGEAKSLEGASTKWRERAELYESE